MRILFLMLSLFMAIAWQATVYALENTDGNPNDPLVKIRLLPERATIKPGDELWIGTEQSITLHWHTYWKNPGDSGTATSITWDLPEGFEISDIYWPTPEKLPYGPLLNYGYEDKVILLQKLKTPDTLPEGQITLTANIELLVCKEECIPEYGTYTITFNGPNAAAEDNSNYLKAAREKLPRQENWSAHYSEDEEHFILETKVPENIRDNINLSTAALLPADWGLLQNPETPQAFIRDNHLVIKQKRGERALTDVKTISNLLTFTLNNGKTHAVEIEATPLATEKPAIQKHTSDLTILTAILFALLGGLILNLMPCVFPVLSIKALSLVKISEKDAGLARQHGLSYTAGVIISFLIIAGSLIALQSGGSQIGWGFQLQNPWIVGALGYLLFLIGLNLMGFFEITNPFGNVGGRLTQNDGLTGSFFTGVLATLVATPCTAPFMAGAIGFAFVQPPLVSLVVFAALGLGLALPYLALSFAPALQKALPKPGPWMEIFKQALAFPMLAAALWLLWVLAQQTDIMGITAALFGAMLLTFSIWLFKHVPDNPLWHNIIRAIAVLAVLGAFAILPKESQHETAFIKAESSFGQAFSQEKLEQSLKDDHPVFTEMTAAWCITCKVNHKIAINISSTKKLFADHNVEYLVGDWTNEDPEITKYLQKYGRNGVPLYIYYGPRDPVTKQRPEPNILPQVLTPGIIGDIVKGE